MKFNLVALEKHLEGSGFSQDNKAAILKYFELLPMRNGEPSTLVITAGTASGKTMLVKWLMNHLPAGCTAPHTPFYEPTLIIAKKKCPLAIVDNANAHRELLVIRNHKTREVVFAGSIYNMVLLDSEYRKTFPLFVDGHPRLITDCEREES